MISKEEALQLYEDLVLARFAEEKIRELYPKNEIKSPVHLGIGGEAIPVGVCHVLPEGTRYFGTYRNHTLYLTLSGDTDGFFGELYGKTTGSARGKGGSMHMMAPEHGLVATSAVVGTTIPLAVGAAFAQQYRGSSDWVAVFFGDGAMEEGVFWESLNFACLHRLRILFVCEDNDLAIHSFAKDRRGYKSVSEVVGGFSCHVSSGDGKSLSEVIRHSRTLVEKMVQDPKPGFMHLTYFRFLEHVGPHEDFQAGYRPCPTPEELQERDPLVQFRRDFEKWGYSEKELQAVEAKVRIRIDQSAERARGAPFPAPEELLTDLWA